jgi:hypothetical protein
MKLFLRAFFILNLSFSILHAQKEEAAEELLFKVNQAILDIEADHLGQLYLLYSDKLVKTDEDGNEISRFSRPDLGIPDHVQVYDPMRILLHYSAFNQIILLDNRLNPLTEAISFFNLGLVDVPSSALADENFVWAYDQVYDQLLKIDIRVPEVSFRTPPITQLIQKESTFIQLRSNVRGVVILVDKGVIEFDAMGNFSSFTSFDSGDDLHLIENGWILSTKGALHRKKKSKVLTIPFKSSWSISSQSVIFSIDKQVFSSPVVH